MNSPSTAPQLSGYTHVMTQESCLGYQFADKILEITNASVRLEVAAPVNSLQKCLDPNILYWKTRRSRQLVWISCRTGPSVPKDIWKQSKAMPGNSLTDSSRNFNAIDITSSIQHLPIITKTTCPFSGNKVRPIILQSIHRTRKADAD